MIALSDVVDGAAKGLGVEAGGGDVYGDGGVNGVVGGLGYGQG